LGNRDEAWLSAAFLAAAAIALGHALQINNGFLHPDAIRWLTVALACGAAGVVVPRVARLERLGILASIAVLGAGLAWQLMALASIEPGIYQQLSPGWQVPFVRALWVAAIVAASLFVAPRRGKHLQVLLLLGVFFGLGLWLIRTSPSPAIDVFVFQQQGSQALLHGHDPYSASFQNIYGTPAFYNPELVTGGRLAFGVPYPPLSLLLALPAYVLAGDVRYAQLVAMMLSAALMAYARPGRLGALAAALYLSTPRAFFVLEQAWTEPFVVLLMSAVVFSACRWPRGMPYALGLLLAVKQYMVLAFLPALWLLTPGPFDWRRQWQVAWKAGATALVVTLPLALFDLPAFWRSVVTLQWYQPFRIDALSYLAWAVKAGGPVRGPAWTLAAAAAGLAIGLWRAPRTPSGFAATVALTSLGFFAFSKQGFGNYYYFVVGALCLAIAATKGSEVPDGVGVPRGSDPPSASGVRPPSSARRPRPELPTSRRGSDPARRKAGLTPSVWTPGGVRPHPRQL
jgi:hypothetical protein